MNFSLQLWSVHKSAEQDFKKTVKTISEHGWKGVEFAGFAGLSAEEMKQLLAENHLYAVGSHTGMQQFSEDAEALLAYHQAIGAQYMIIPAADCSSMEKVRQIIEVLNQTAKLAKKYNVKVGYHNHADEFNRIDGKYIMDWIAEETSEDVVLEIDVFWVKYAGLDPVAYIQKWGKRVELVHLKQIASDCKTDTILSEGIIDMKEIADAAKYATHLIVEQEGDIDELDASRKNAEFLNRIF